MAAQGLRAPHLPVRQDLLPDALRPRHEEQLEHGRPRQQSLQGGRLMRKWLVVALVQLLSSTQLERCQLH